MADVNISKYTTQVVREGSKPASPGFVVSEGQDPVNPPGTNNYVPYSGATANVELGEFGLETGFVTLDTTPTNIPTEQGGIYWDDSRSTAALIMNGVLQHIGQDTFFYVKNSTGSSIAKGTAVRFDGTDGASGHLKIAPFLANGTYPSNYFVGVTAESIANGAFGQVMHFGELDGINTSGYTAGDLLYASTTVAGAFQTTAPVAPNNIVLIAAAINSKNNGTILVRPTYGSNINTDEGVKITSGTTGDLLQLQAGGLWENKTLAQVIGSAYVPSTRTITINGTTQDLSANRTYNVGTVTAVTASSPLFSSGGTTPNITIQQASGSQSGFLSSTDWTTFNSKASMADLANYLPLSGGTLTGPLNGTSASFSSFGRFGGSNIGTNFAVNMGANTSIYFNEIDSATAELSAVNNLNTAVKILRIQAPGGATQVGGTLAVTGDATFTTTITAGALSRIGNVFIAGRTGTYVTYSDGIFGDNLHLGATGTGGAVYINTALNRNFIVNPVGGNLLVGTTTDNGEKLQTVGGSVSFTGVNDGTAIFARRTGGANVFALNVNLDSSWTMYDYASGSYLTGITQKNGNVGIGVTPSAWDTGNTVKAVEISQGAFWGYGTTNVYLGSNYYWNGTNRIYLKTAAAAEYSITNGAHEWYSAASGTAGTAVTLTPRMSITSSGNVLIGTTTDNGAKLQVSGTATVSSSFTAANIFNVSSITGYSTFTGNVGGNQFSHSLGLAVAWNYTNGGGEVAFSSNKGAGGVGGYKFYDWDGTTSTLLLTILPSGAATFSSLGTGTVYSNGGTLTNTNPSDLNLKTNIAPINYGLDEILKLNPVTFDWKNDTINQGKQYGFIAQEVQKIMPDLVKKGEYLGLDKEAIFTTLVKAIQELNDKIK